MTVLQIRISCIILNVLLLLVPLLIQGSFVSIISSTKHTKIKQQNYQHNNNLKRDSYYRTLTFRRNRSFTRSYARVYKIHNNLKMKTSSDTVVSDNNIATSSKENNNNMRSNNNVDENKLLSSIPKQQQYNNLEQEEENNNVGRISFSHVHMYVDHIEDYNVYETLGKQLDQFTTELSINVKENENNMSIDSKRQLWNRIVSLNDNNSDELLENGIIIKKQKMEYINNISSSTSYISQNRDIIKQLMVGFGFRVTGIRYHNDDDDKDHTRTVLVTSRDPNGIKYLISSTTSSPMDVVKNNDAAKELLSPISTHDVLHINNVHQFYNSHSQHQGIGVLAFLVESIDTIYQRYQKLHPNLIASKYYSSHNIYMEEKALQILEVYAFYKKDEIQDTQQAQDKEADTGTILRFIEWNHNSDIENNSDDDTFIHNILGLKKVNANFVDLTSQAAYCDHWVSNVFDRNEFLNTLHDTLQFTSKVDFNAGVVAAGEAQIESTVTGNNNAPTSLVHLSNEDNTAHDNDNDDMILLMNTILKDQNQVYLPINNALSKVGHVYYFLEQLGQGIQHIASRVLDLISFVQRCNEFRDITNEGFSFLRIPRSYYGVLTIQQLTADDNGNTQLLSMECAIDIITKLRQAGYISKENAIQLHVSQDDIDLILETKIDNDNFKSEYHSKKEIILDIIMKSRYCNLYSLLRDQISEEQYIGIVTNQILVDVQGNDLLYQIFTSNILQRSSTDEAPFLEFIQRVCSTKNTYIKPGCGGFGIRNFLTLFLSIEVSKAMQEVTDAIEAGDVKQQQYAQEMVDCFTMQLNESNPILTFIADAMTDEGKYKELMANSYEIRDLNEASMWESKMIEASLRKKEGNLNLMTCSTKYKDKMKSIREERQKAVMI